MSKILDYNKVFETLVDETAKYLIDNHLKTMVLGISGGLDSTVCAAICSEVVNRFPSQKFRFIGVSLPCSSNKENENNSALLTMKAFCHEDDYWVENLQKEYMLMKATCEQHFSSTRISQGNIKARLRMIYLYNIASVMNGLVIDTDNMTENNLGFFTIHGDVCDFNPIGGLWKHEVYELARNLYSFTFNLIPDKFNALKAACDITPTDGNGVADGGDMAQIAPGHTYEEVDDILQSFLDKGDEGIVECYKKYGTETVDKVLRRHEKSAFKRKHLPIVIKRELYEN